MSKEEALKYFKDMRRYWPTGWPTQEFDAAIAALSQPCPNCGGREPLARGRAIHVDNPKLGKYWIVYEAELAGDDMRPVIILPTEEEEL